MWRLGVITDEIDGDLERALAVASELGLREVELNSLWGRNIVELSEDEIEKAESLLRAAGSAFRSSARLPSSRSCWMQLPLRRSCRIFRRISPGFSAAANWRGVSRLRLYVSFPSVRVGCRGLAIRRRACRMADRYRTQPDENRDRAALAAQEAQNREPPCSWRTCAPVGGTPVRTQQGSSRRRIIPRSKPSGTLATATFRAGIRFPKAMKRCVPGSPMFTSRTPLYGTPKQD